MAETPPSRVSYDFVTRAIARTLGNPGKGYYALLALAVALLGVGIVCLLFLLRYGLGLAGYSHPVYWAVYITCFVFWVGIAHSGTLISAILFLFRSGWRTAVYRTAEAMTVFAVITAGLFPLIHIGRQWYFYWLVPYPNERGLWPNFKSPLIWDEFAIGTYLTVSTVFLIMGLIPDIAAVRDVATGWRKKLYAVTSLGWRGTNEQWRHYTRGYLYLAALATPLVLSVHSVVSWDFAMAIVPGWHATLFAPYFVAGAIYSGVAMVITLLVPIRKLFHLEELITVHHFENLAKLCLLTGSIVSFSYLTENFVAWFSVNSAARAAFWYRAFAPYWWASWTMNICNGLLPWLLWSKKIRTNITALFVISIFVNIGMWFERYVIILVSLAGEPFERLANALTAIFHPPPTPGVLGVFGHVDATVDAIAQLRRAGHTDFTVYSPIPRHEIEDALEQPVSPVRMFTLIGGIAGCAIGAWVTLYMSYDWPLVLGGKPIGSIPPYVVIMFEMTILFGALSTILGIAFNALFAARRLGTVAYDPRFTNDKFGIFVPSEPARAGQVETLLRGAGAEEVRRA